MGSGYDFSDDDSVISEQRDAARMAEEWRNLNAKAISGELNGINNRVTVCILQLSKMISENDYKKTNDRLQALLFKDLGPDGWMWGFLKTNVEYFAENSRDKKRTGLSPDEQELFDTVCKYYDDVDHIMNAVADIFNLIRMLPLEEGFKIIRLKDNFDEAGFDSELYKRVDYELERISMFLNWSWEDLEKFAYSSREFLDNNIGKLGSRELDKQYRARRMADYQNLVLSHGLGKSFTASPDGHFYAKPDILAMTGVVDDYTARVAWTADDIKGKLQATINESKKAREGALATADKLCVTQAGRFLQAAFDELVKAISDFAEMALDVYGNFKEGNSAAPYCFMKKLSAISSVKPKYDFYPNVGDPWDSGTYYRDIYTEGASALGAQARLFAYDHGTIIL